MISNVVAFFSPFLIFFHSLVVVAILAHHRMLLAIRDTPRPHKRSTIHAPTTFVRKKFISDVHVLSLVS